MRNVVVFGGSGFVGTHLERALAPRVERIYIADLVVPAAPGAKTLFVPTDVRARIDPSRFADPPDTIINLAAIHKTPGHSASEYFETNILGAQNVTRFAQELGIRRVLFTSSISVYGPGEDEKSETSVPMPAIPYGSSKAIGEYIHRELIPGGQDRLLCILRPGVVFGQGERGNFTRIAHALEKGLFVYPGRKDTIKSCIYVKDLCRLIVRSLQSSPGSYLFNACFPQTITTEAICRAFHEVLQYPLPRLVLPQTAVHLLGRLLQLTRIARLIGLDIHPERIAKLTRSTYISARQLEASGFRFQYGLAEAISDWSKDCGGKSLF